MICADIANRSKHLELRPDRIRKDARVRGDIGVAVGDAYDGAESPARATWDYVVVLGDGSSRPALDVARDAAKDWKTVLSSYRLTP